MTCEEIIADHPHLTPDDIRAAQAFTADYLADDAVILADHETAGRRSDGGRSRLT
jgi:hypothetical protein